MYSFDVDEEKAMETYKEVCLAYERIFQRLDLPAVKGYIDVSSWSVTEHVDREI